MLRHLIALAFGGVVALLALFFVGPPVMQCLGGALCAAYYPTWFASLPPPEQFLVEHRDLIPWAAFALGLVFFLAIEVTGVLADRRGVGR